MRKRIILLFLGVMLACTLIACGSDDVTKDGGVETNDVVEEEQEINKDILAVAEANEQFNTDEIIERANNRMKLDPEFYADSKVPKLDSCVTGIVYDTVNSSDGNYVYFFGEGEEAKDKDMYLSAICAYSAHLNVLGLTYELNEGEICYIYDGSEVVATFMIFDTTEDGYMMIISPQ